MNPFDILVPCIKISRSELLFEQYIMALNLDKYEIEVRNDDAIKRNQRFFDFIQQTVNRLNGLYLRERCFLIYVIMKNLLREKSAADIEKLNRKKEGKKKKGRYI